jgi:hypothetical protein
MMTTAAAPDNALLRGLQLWEEHHGRCDPDGPTQDDLNQVVALIRPTASRSDAHPAIVMIWATILNDRQNHSDSAADAAEAIEAVQRAVDLPDMLRGALRSSRSCLAWLYLARAQRHHDATAARQPTGAGAARQPTDAGAAASVTEDRHSALRLLSLVLDDLCQPAEADYDRFSDYDNYDSERSASLTRVLDLLYSSDARLMTGVPLEPVTDRCRVLLDLLRPTNPDRPRLTLLVGLTLAQLWLQRAMPVTLAAAARFMHSSDRSEFSAEMRGVPGGPRELGVAIDVLQAAVDLHRYGDSRHRQGLIVLGSLLVFRYVMEDPDSSADDLRRAHSSLSLVLDSPDFSFGGRDDYRPMVMTAIYCAVTTRFGVMRPPPDELDRSRLAQDAATLPSESEELLLLSQLVDAVSTERSGKPRLFYYLSCLQTLGPAADELSAVELRALRDRVRKLGADAQQPDSQYADTPLALLQPADVQRAGVQRAGVQLADVQLAGTLEELFLRSWAPILDGTLGLLAAGREIAGSEIAGSEIAGSEFAGPAVEEGLATIRSGAIRFPPGNLVRHYLLAQLAAPGPHTARHIVWTLFGGSPP